MISIKNIKRMCDDYQSIENYDLAINDKQMWECHHRLEISEDGLHTIYSKNKLIELGLYWHRPSNELIFLSKHDHRTLHYNTIEVKKQRSDAKIGENAPLFGKHHSEEVKRKIAEGNKIFHQKKKMENQ